MLYRSQAHRPTGLISVLLVSTSILAAPAYAQDGPSSAREAEAESGSAAQNDRVIIVTGTATGTDILSTPSDVSSLGGDLKEDRQRASLGDSIDYFAGVDTISTGSNVGKPVIRGLSGNRVRVLSDEMPLDFQQFGVRHPPNLDPYPADRIEVVRGPASILYGSEAIGGVVNVISDRPPSADPGETIFSGEVSGNYQSAFRQLTGVVSADAASGRLGISGTLVRRSSDGLVTPEEPTALQTGDVDGPLVTGKVPFTDFDQTNGDIALGYETGRGQIVLRYEGWRNEHNFVVPDPPPPNGNPLQAGGVGQTLDNDIVHLFADLDVGSGITLRPGFGYARNLRISNPGPPEPLGRAFLPDAQVLNILRENYSARLEAQHGKLFGALEGRVGIQYEHVDQFSRGSTALTPGGSVDKLGLFALEEASFGRLILNVGARLDYVRTEADPGRTRDDSGLPTNPGLLENDYTIFSGSIGAVYRVTETLSLTANVGRGFRAPTLFELYVSGVHGGVAAVQQGDATLQEETSVSFDGSLRYADGTTTVKLTGYGNVIDNYIFPAGTGTNAANGLPIFQISQQDAELYGADLEAEVRPYEWLSLRGQAQYVDGELDDGNQIPLLPPFKASAEARFKSGPVGPFEELSASVGFRYAADQESAGLIEPFGQFDGAPPPFGTGSTDDYFLTDISVGADLGVVDISLAARNLFDVAYRDFLDTYKNITLSPGRNVVVNVSTSF